MKKIERCELAGAHVAAGTIKASSCCSSSTTVNVIVKKGGNEHTLV